MDFFDQDPEALVKAREMVRLFTRSQGVREEDLLLPSLAIVTFSRRVLDGLVRLTGGKRVESWRGRNPNLFSTTVGNRPFVLTKSPYGAAVSVMLLEEIIAYGVNRTVFVGYCGSIQNDVGLGQVVLPTHAVREDGTSHHYLPRDVPCRPDGSLLDALHRGLRQKSVVAKAGPVWTTDALYRETEEKIDKYRAQGVLAVEMEMSALFAVGAVRKVGIGSLLLVSDHFSHDGWNPGFFNPVLLEKERTISRLIPQWIEGNLI